MSPSLFPVTQSSENHKQCNSCVYPPTFGVIYYIAIFRWNQYLEAGWCQNKNLKRVALTWDQVEAGGWRLEANKRKISGDLKKQKKPLLEPEKGRPSLWASVDVTQLVRLLFIVTWNELRALAEISRQKAENAERFLLAVYAILQDNELKNHSAFKQNTEKRGSRTDSLARKDSQCIKMALGQRSNPEHQQ